MQAVVNVDQALALCQPFPVTDGRTVRWEDIAPLISADEVLAIYLDAGANHAMTLIESEGDLKITQAVLSLPEMSLESVAFVVLPRARVVSSDHLEVPRG